MSKKIQVQRINNAGQRSIMVHPAMDKWLAKSVEAEERSEAEAATAAAAASLSPSPEKMPRWSRKDDKEIDEMLGLGDHRPPVHQMSNENIMTIIGIEKDRTGDNDCFDDDEGDVSTLANDTIANGTFFRNNRTEGMSPPRQIRHTDVNLFKNPDLVTQLPNPRRHHVRRIRTSNGKLPNNSGAKKSPTNTAPESSMSSPRSNMDEGLFGEIGDQWTMRFIRLLVLFSFLSVFLITIIAVLSHNLIQIRTERINSEATKADEPYSRDSPANTDDIAFDFARTTFSPTLYVTPAPSISTGPTITSVPTNIPKPSLRPTHTPTTGAPSYSPSRNPTTSSPTAQGPTISPTMSPTGQPTTESSTIFVEDFLIGTIIKWDNLSLETISVIQQRDERNYAFQVVKWLAEDPNLATYDDKTLKERFALSCFYLGLTGGEENNPLAETWMTYTPICSWMVTSERLCISNGKPSSIFLENLDLTGILAPELSLIGDSLEMIHLTNNKIEGTIPTEFGRLSELRRIRMHNNMLEGTLPTEIGNLHKLLSLRIGRNNLYGTLPTELGNLKDALTLHMPWNKFTGTIPIKIAQMTSLLAINLKENELSGDIPSIMGGIPNLKILEVQGNNLVGEVPRRICQKSLDLLKVDCEEVECNCCKKDSCEN